MTRSMAPNEWVKAVKPDFVDGKPCAFCNTRQPESQVIGGPDGIKICRDCVSLCSDIIRDRDNQARANAIAALVQHGRITTDRNDDWKRSAECIYTAIAEGKIPGVRIE